MPSETIATAAPVFNSDLVRILSAFHRLHDDLDSAIVGSSLRGTIVGDGCQIGDWLRDLAP